jgi:hypothetical protein
MSDKLQVIIESRENFFDIIKNMTDLVDQDFSLISFRDSMNRVITGCSCKKKENLAAADEVYLNLNKKISYNAVNLLKERLNADKLIFFKDKNELLFSL